jgi:hypothetical protein
VQPLIDRCERIGTDESARRFGKIGETIEPLPWMRHEDERDLLEHSRDDIDRHVRSGRVEGLDNVGAHVELDPSGGKQQAVVGLRAALNDRHVEPIFRIGSVGERLIEAAVFGLRPPIGGKGHLVESKGWTG